MPELRFTKGHGTGNDFVLLADPDDRLDLSPSDVVRLCDRHTGIGADGVLRAVRATAGDADWVMDYRNADGSLAEMCGNGIRVFTAFLIAEGLLELADHGTVRVSTRGGVLPVRRSAEGFAVDLGSWTTGGGDVEVAVDGLAVVRPGYAVQVPNPHVVVVVADDDELDAAELGRAPRLEPAPPSGANVELVRPGEPLVRDGVGRIRMRVHERGSGETRSCGTGAVAAAVATRHFAGAGAPDDWEVQVPGGRLRVRMLPVQGGEHAELSGPAELVYSGSIEVRAALMTR